MADEKKPEPGHTHKGPHMRLAIDEATAQGLYSNFVMINHTENEFVLDFAYVAPGAPEAKVRARVISTPRHAKRLLRALSQNVERYEQRFGPIEIPATDTDGAVN